MQELWPHLSYLGCSEGKVLLVLGGTAPIPILARPASIGRGRGPIYPISETGIQSRRWKVAGSVRGFIRRRQARSPSALGPPPYLQSQGTRCPLPAGVYSLAVTGPYPPYPFYSGVRFWFLLRALSILSSGEVRGRLPRVGGNSSSPISVLCPVGSPSKVLKKVALSTPSRIRGQVSSVSVSPIYPISAHYRS